MGGEGLCILGIQLGLYGFGQHMGEGRPIAMLDGHDDGLGHAIPSDRLH